MKKTLGYVLFGLGLLIFWPVQIGLGLYGLYYIITAFIKAGIVAGFISIPIVGVCLGIVYLIIHLLSTPFTILASSLLGRDNNKVNQQEINRRVLEASHAEYEREMTHIRNQLRKVYISQGMTTEEADKKIMEDEQAGNAAP